MENTIVGKVMVPARLENFQDLYESEKGRLLPEQVRSVEVACALVDTGATMLSAPKRLVQRLGLRHCRTRTARTSAGTADFGIYAAVRLTVQGRDCVMEVAELPDDCPVLIGQIPLEALDFIVDPIGQRLLGNPEHGGEQMIDLF